MNIFIEKNEHNKFFHFFDSLHHVNNVKIWKKCVNEINY